VSSDRVAVIVTTGEHRATSDYLRAASNLLISFREWRYAETHFGTGSTGDFSGWVHNDWLEHDDGSKPVPAAYQHCPRCAGSVIAPVQRPVECQFCLGHVWRDEWHSGVAYPVEWIRTEFERGRLERRPRYLICPGGRLHWGTWYEFALREFDGCWLVPMLAWLS
jgi:hypothetical protein